MVVTPHRFTSFYSNLDFFGLLTERGTYNQYEPAKAIAEIRKLRLARYSDTQIWRDMMKIPRSTFYYFVSKMHEWDKQIHEQERVHYKEQLREDILNARERLFEKLQQLEDIIKSGSKKEQIEAIREARETEIAIIKLGYEKPVILGEGENDSRQTTDSEQQVKQAASH